MEKIIATVLHGAHRLQVEEAVNALDEGLKGFYESGLDRQEGRVPSTSDLLGLGAGRRDTASLVARSRSSQPPAPEEPYSQTPTPSPSEPPSSDYPPFPGDPNGALTCDEVGGGPYSVPPGSDRDSDGNGIVCE